MGVNTRDLFRSIDIAMEIDGIDRYPWYVDIPLIVEHVNPDRHARIRAKHFHMAGRMARIWWEAFPESEWTPERLRTAHRHITASLAFDSCDWGCS